MKALPLEHVHRYMPHSGPMMLLDKILRYDDQGLVATAILDEQNIFVENQQFPAWAAMELMAQGVAAWAGCLADDEGEPVRLGFLLGTRKLQWYFESLAVPCEVQIQVQLSIQDTNGFGVFDAQLWLLDQQGQTTTLLAQGALNVYSPKEEIPYDE